MLDATDLAYLPLVPEITGYAAIYYESVLRAASKLGTANSAMHLFPAFRSSAAEFWCDPRILCALLQRCRL